MHDILYGLLARERPLISSVVGHKTVNSRDLSVTELRYVQGGKFYAARSFHTDCWISSSPLGPIGFAGSRTFQCEALADVAEITSYGGIRELDARRWPEQSALIALQNTINSAVERLVRSKYSDMEMYFHCIYFRFTPYPYICICCTDSANKNKMLGVISIDVSGITTILSKCDDIIVEIASRMRCNALPPMTQEVLYE